jgi:hypothetical protein
MTTMWSRLPTQEEGLRRVDELQELDGFLKPAIVKHSKLVHHTQDTVENARGILRQILTNHPIPLSIQEEIYGGKTITETDAGKALDEKLTKLAQEYEQKLKEQTEAAKQAMLKQDEETRQEQLEEAKRFRQLLTNLEEQKRDQVRQYQLLQEQLAEAEQKRGQAMGEAEEMSLEDAQPDKVGWRQELRAFERRRAHGTVDSKERMRNPGVSSSSYSGRPNSDGDDDYEECPQGPPEEEGRKSKEAQDSAKARRGRGGVEAPEQRRVKEKADADAETRSRTHGSIHEPGGGAAVEEKLAQLEFKLKTQFEAAEQGRREKDEEIRKERLEQAERIRQLLEKLEVLQEKFVDAERKHEQGIREAEEKIQAVDVGWRQEVEAVKQRQAKEKADLEERLKNITVAPNPPNDGVISFVQGWLPLW